ncbi:uncharacterized protein FIBRA_02752 [Fibroporia radiculosa]|uniref:F-box domain-containing protein n=1 Tax=Fibroporia radiculosa TaxID=599839 RepID=J4HVF5_9APHY|nr:uncharacterized protein FIBRA_02752 [Fibroporia radiculosa]CCM00712.1 predicted protein [Fibroporia radiculosa]
MSTVYSLASVPQEVLEHIAFFTATDSFLGPPSGLAPLLATASRLHAALSFDSNPHLWARIFAAKFDLDSAIRRLGYHNTTPVALAHELRKRCQVLKRIRARTDARAPAADLSFGHRRILSEILWTAYLMMLEDDGKNERQLREYAHIDDWLKEYLLHPTGASLIRSSASAEKWPAPWDERTSLALWLFWFLLRPEEFMMDTQAFHEAVGVLKLVALGAHQYALGAPSWREFEPTYRLEDASPVTHYSHPLRMRPPAIAVPAILAYLSLVHKLSISWDAMSYMKPPSPSLPSANAGSRTGEEWDAEWERAVHATVSETWGDQQADGQAYTPGSLQGSWEGLFTYTEFTSYAALLSGASPSVLERSLVAQHPQLWKIREHHLYVDDYDDSSGMSVLDPVADAEAPVSASPKASTGTRIPRAGCALCAYIPSGTELHEGPDSLEVRELGQEPLVYESCLTTPYPYHTARSTNEESPALLSALLATEVLDEISTIEDFASADRYVVNKGLTNGGAVIQRGLIFWLYPTGEHGPTRTMEDGLVRKHGVLITATPGARVEDIKGVIHSALIADTIQHVHIPAPGE